MPKTCSDCSTRNICKEICPEIEAQLPKPRGGGHRKEFPTDNIEGIYQKVKDKEKGWRKQPNIYGDNWATK